jgi:hypothetical protein
MPDKTYNFGPNNTSHTMQPINHARDKTSVELKITKRSRPLHFPCTFSVDPLRVSRPKKKTQPTRTFGPSHKHPIIKIPRKERAKQN